MLRVFLKEQRYETTDIFEVLKTLKSIIYFDGHAYLNDRFNSIPIFGEIICRRISKKEFKVCVRRAELLLLLGILE